MTIKGVIKGKVINVTVAFSKQEYFLVRRTLEKTFLRALNCVGCGACTCSCPTDALKVTNRLIKIDSTKCVNCLQCIKIPCTIEDSEMEQRVIKLSPFLFSPCMEGLPMNHLIFPNEDLGRKFAERLYTEKIKFEVHENGKIICVDSKIPEKKLFSILLVDQQSGKI